LAGCEDDSDSDYLPQRQVRSNSAKYRGLYRNPGPGSQRSRVEPKIAIHAATELDDRDWHATLISMETTCTRCHVVLAADTKADWCPACGAALIQRKVPPALANASGPPPEVDHRGILLPRRHALGGIITPQ
jgi:hypothetical protein